MSDGFLARWSRRKRDEARRPAEPPAPPPDAASPGVAPAEDDTSLSPEELAQLPSLEALTAATDLAPFLRAGVPRALRNAALRRMWSVDPAIRDFVSEAREYAYDWNTPGGVPGTGGAISAEDVRAMVEKVFGGGEEKTSATSGESDAAEESAGFTSPGGRGEGVSQEEASPETPSHPPLTPRSIDHEVAGALSPPAGSGDAHHPSCERSAVGEKIPCPSPDAPSPPRLRRHGGALPI